MAGLRTDLLSVKICKNATKISVQRKAEIHGTVGDEAHRKGPSRPGGPDGGGGEAQGGDEAGGVTDLAQKLPDHIPGNRGHGPVRGVKIRVAGKKRQTGTLLEEGSLGQQRSTGGGVFVDGQFPQGQGSVGFDGLLPDGADRPEAEALIIAEQRRLRRDQENRFIAPFFQLLQGGPDQGRADAKPPAAPEGGDAVDVGGLPAL